MEPQFLFPLKVANESQKVKADGVGEARQSPEVQILKKVVIVVTEGVVGRGEVGNSQPA